MSAEDPNRSAYALARPPSLRRQLVRAPSIPFAPFLPCKPKTFGVNEPAVLFCPNVIAPVNFRDCSRRGHHTSCRLLRHEAIVLRVLRLSPGTPLPHTGIPRVRSNLPRAKYCPQTYAPEQPEDATLAAVGLAACQAIVGLQATSHVCQIPICGRLIASAEHRPRLSVW